ncbi:MAG: hypothetical protein ABEJ74_04020 [Haloferacaceae archaeon]
MTVEIPQGSLVRSRVVADPGVALADALDRELTGYAVLAPQDALLLDAETRGVLTFEDGVPVLAYERGSDSGGPAALGALAVPGPYSADLFELPAAALATAHESTDLRVQPGLPADRLAGDADLAERTRAAAPDDRRDAPVEEDPVAAFLADEEKIAAIRADAREEARERADEWGLADQLEGGVSSADRDVDDTGDAAPDADGDAATDADGDARPGE